MRSFFDRTRKRSRSPVSRWSSRNEITRPITSAFISSFVSAPEQIKFEKCFYREHLSSKERSQVDVDNFRERFKMVLMGSEIPRPVFSFIELSLPDHIAKIFLKNGWKTPTPIQSQGWPMVLSGRDVVGIAQTGSGKTATFLVPALVHIAAQPRLKRNEGPICLVIVPTRELAQQVLTVANDFTIAAGLRTMCFYGGSPKGPQLRELQIGAEICISTPGRLLDFIQQYKNLLSRVTFLVLDEADRMLDMGFEPQIRKIINNTRSDRQTVMWSATWPKDVQTLAKDFLKNYIQVNIGSESLHANPNITQIVEIVDEWRKEDRLLQLLTSFGKARCIVFIETKRKTDRVAYSLKRKGFSVGAMHGDKQQSDREMTLTSFREGQINILLATDVASRGLDIDDIQFVVNMDFPNQTEDYVHRIGRTARSNKKGTAFTFFNSKNAKQAKDLIGILQEANQEIIPELYKLAGAIQTNRKTAFSKKYNTPIQRDPTGRMPNSGFGNPHSNYDTQHIRSIDGSSSLTNKTITERESHSNGSYSFKVGTNNDSGYNDLNSVASAYNAGASLNSVKVPRSEESKTSRFTGSNFVKPTVNSNVIVVDNGKWDRNAIKPDNNTLAALNYNASTDPNWQASQWANNQQAQLYWNATTLNQAYQLASDSVLKGSNVVDQQTPNATNFHNPAAVNFVANNAIPTFTQPWPGYVTTLPGTVASNPAISNWGVNWVPNYHGSY